MFQQLGQKDNHNHYRNQNLKVLPVLPQLTILDLSGNLFTIIPMQVFNMQLKRLIFKDNLLTCISDDIIKLQALEYLDVSYNYIRRIPNGMDKLLQLRYCNFNSNFIEDLENGIFETSLTFLGVASNRFTQIPRQISKLLTTLQQLELDWLHYCNLSYFIDEPLKYKLIACFTNDCTFAQFYHFFIKQPFDSNFEKILTNHSLGLLTLHVRQAKQITMKNLIFAVSQQATKENMKCLYYLIELLGDYDLELLNIIYVLAARMNQNYLLDKLLNYPIDLHYSIKFDLICHHKILIIKGQTPFTTLLQHNKNLEAVLDAWVRRGFKPNLKQQGENCLHIAIKQSYEGVKWALKYCNPNKQESSQKNTPLHILFQRQQSIELFFLLENNRANPFIVNIHNRIPRFYQTQMVQLRFVKLFIKYEKGFMRDHILNYNFNKLHEMIQSGSRNNCRECEISGTFSAETAVLITVQSYEQILGEISKTIRTTKSITQIIEKFNNSLLSMPDYQGKFYYLTFYYLIKAKLKFGWKYVPSFLIVVLINTFQYNMVPSLKYHENQQQLIKQHKIQVQQQYFIQQGEFEQDQQIHLSQKLKHNLKNIMDSQTNQRFFENSIIQQIQVAYLNELSQATSTINQYELFHTNHKAKRIPHIKKQEECANIPESPKHTLNDKMKQAHIVNAKFKEFQDQSKQRSKSQIDL